MQSPEEPKHSYRVMIDDNFHYMDESERYFHGEFATCEEAQAACRKIVDEYLLSAYEPGMTDIELWSSYSNFGEDPFILTADEQCRFSAWTYARERCDVLCGPLEP